MASDVHGANMQEESQAAQDNGCQRAMQERPKMSGEDWGKAIAERDGRIAELEQHVDERILWEVAAAPKLECAG